MDKIQNQSKQYEKLTDSTLQVITQPPTPDPITAVYYRPDVEDALAQAMATHIQPLQDILDQMDAQGISDPAIVATPPNQLSDNQK